MDLNLDEILKGAKATDYLKAFKNKPFWKNKANFAVFMTGYKLDKKTTIAIPFKKDIEAKTIFKRIKKEKIHALNKVSVGCIVYEENSNKFIFTVNGGAADFIKLETAGQKLFEKMKVGFAVKMGEIDPEMQVLASEVSQEISDDNDSDEEIENILFDWTNLANEGVTLFKEASEWVKNPQTNKIEELYNSITIFLADYKVAIADSDNITPPPTLIKCYNQLEHLLNKLDIKLNKPKNKINEKIVELYKEYDFLFNEIKDQIIPLLKKDIRVVLNEPQNAKVERALLLIKNLKQEFPKTDIVVQNKLQAFFKNLDVHEPQLKGILNRIQDVTSKTIEAIKIQLQKLQIELEQKIQSLSIEQKQFLGI